eukprot:458494_1
MGQFYFIGLVQIGIIFAAPYMELINDTAYITCNSTYSCAANELHCNQVSGSYTACEVSCFGGGGCTSHNAINCDGYDCTVNCITEASCYTLYVNGPSGHSFTMNCNGINACVGSILYTNGASIWTLNGCTKQNSCQGMEIHFPPNRNGTPVATINNANIYGLNGEPKQLKFVATNGWNDIQFVNFTGPFDPLTHKGTMHCVNGQCNFVTNLDKWSCDINNNICYNPMTNSPTKQPSNNPSQSPTIVPTTNNPTWFPTFLPTAQETTSVFEYNSEISDSTADSAQIQPLFEAIMIALVSIFVIIGVIGFIDAKFLRLNDFYSVGKIFQVMLQILDMMSDCFLAIDISLRIKNNSFLIALCVCIIFIIIPSVFSLFQVYYHSKKEWSSDDRIRGWLVKYSNMLYIISILTGSSFAAVDIMNSNLFGLQYFEMGLSNKQRILFKTKRIYSVVMLENIPQLALQIWYMVQLGNNYNLIAISSAVFSGISIIVTVLSMT